jgi:hypothetical protein
MILILVILVIATLIITISILQGYTVRKPYVAIAGMVRLIAVELPILVISILGFAIGAVFAIAGAFLASLIPIAILSAIFPSINTAEGFGHIQTGWFIFLEIAMIVWIIAICTIGSAGVFFGLAMLFGLFIFLSLHASLFASGFTIINVLMVVLVFCFIVIGFHSIKNR